MGQFHLSHVYLICLIWNETRDATWMQQKDIYYVGNSHFPNPVKSNGLVFASPNLKHYISLCSSLLDLKWFLNAVIWFHHQKARSGDTGKWCYQLFLRHNTVVCFKRLTVVLFKGIMKFFSASYYELLFCGSVLSSNDLI